MRSGRRVLHVCSALSPTGDAAAGVVIKKIEKSNNVVDVLVIFREFEVCYVIFLRV